MPPERARMKPAAPARRRYCMVVSLERRTIALCIDSHPTDSTQQQVQFLLPANAFLAGSVDQDLD